MFRLGTHLLGGGMVMTRWGKEVVVFGPVEVGVVITVFHKVTSWQTVVLVPTWWLVSIPRIINDREMATRLFLKPIHSAAPHPSSGIHGKTWTHVLHYCVEVDVCALLLVSSVMCCIVRNSRCEPWLYECGGSALCDIACQSQCGPWLFDSGGSCPLPRRASKQMWASAIWYWGFLPCAALCLIADVSALGNFVLNLDFKSLAIW
jgi:hypothetical protein